MRSHNFSNFAAKQFGKQIRTILTRQISTIAPNLATRPFERRVFPKSIKPQFTPAQRRFTANSEPRSNPTPTPTNPHHIHPSPSLPQSTHPEITPKTSTGKTTAPPQNPLSSTLAADLEQPIAQQTTAQAIGAKLPNSNANATPHPNTAQFQIEFNDKVFKQSQHIQGSIPHAEFPTNLPPQTLKTTSTSAASPFTSITFISLISIIPVTILGAVCYSNPVYALLTWQKVKRLCYTPKYFEQYVFFHDDLQSPDSHGYLSLECDLRDEEHLPVNILQAQRIVLREVGKFYKSVSLINQLRSQFGQIMEIPGFKNDRTFQAQIQTMKSNKAELDDLLQGLTVGFIKPVIDIEKSCLVGMDEFDRKYDKMFKKLYQEQIDVQKVDAIKLISLKQDKEAREANAQHSGMQRTKRINNNSNSLNPQPKQQQQQRQQLREQPHQSKQSQQSQSQLNTSQSSHSTELQTVSIANIVPTSLFDLLADPGSVKSSPSSSTSPPSTQNHDRSSPVLSRSNSSPHSQISPTMQGSEYTADLQQSNISSTLVSTAFDPLASLTPLESTTPDISTSAQERLSPDEQEFLKKATFSTNLQQADLEALAQKRYQGEMKIIEMSQPGYLSRRILSPILELKKSADFYTPMERRQAYFYFLQQQASNIILSNQFLELLIAELRDQIGVILDKKKQYVEQETAREAHINTLAKSVKNDTVWSDNTKEHQDHSILNPHKKQISPFDFVFDMKTFQTLADKTTLAPLAQLIDSGQKQYWTVAAAPEYQINKYHLLDMLNKYPNYSQELKETLGMTREDLQAIANPHEVGRIVSIPSQFTTSQDAWYRNHPFNSAVVKSSRDLDFFVLNPNQSFEDVSIWHGVKNEFNRRWEARKVANEVEEMRQLQEHPVLPKPAQQQTQDNIQMQMQMQMQTDHQAKQQTTKQNTQTGTSNRLEQIELLNHQQTGGDDVLEQRQGQQQSNKQKQTGTEQIIDDKAAV